MKYFKYFCLVGCCLTTHTYATADYFCFSSGGNNILLVSPHVFERQEVKYYPYLKSVKLSKVVKTEYGDEGGFKPQIYYTMNEIVNHKVTGHYRFLVQGYLIDDVSYFNKTTKRSTRFFRVYPEQVKSKKISCV